MLALVLLTACTRVCWSGALIQELWQTLHQAVWQHAQQGVSSFWLSADTYRSTLAVHEGAHRSSICVATYPTVAELALTAGTSAALARDLAYQSLHLTELLSLLTRTASAGALPSSSWSPLARRVQNIMQALLAVVHQYRSMKQSFSSLTAAGQASVVMISLEPVSASAQDMSTSSAGLEFEQSTVLELRALMQQHSELLRFVLRVKQVEWSSLSSPAVTGPAAQVLIDAGLLSHADVDVIHR
mgnify:CR=1 FL=1